MPGLRVAEKHACVGWHQMEYWSFWVAFWSRPTEKIHRPLSTPSGIVLRGRIRWDEISKQAKSKSRHHELPFFRRCRAPLFHIEGFSGTKDLRRNGEKSLWPEPATSLKWIGVMMVGFASVEWRSLPVPNFHVLTIRNMEKASGVLMSWKLWRMKRLNVRRTWLSDNRTRKQQLGVCATQWWPSTTSQPPTTLPCHATSRGFHHHIILSCTIFQLSMYAMTLGTYKHPGVETFAGALIEGLQHHPWPAYQTLLELIDCLNVETIR